LIVPGLSGSRWSVVASASVLFIGAGVTSPTTQLLLACGSRTAEGYCGETSSAICAPFSCCQGRPRDRPGMHAGTTVLPVRMVGITRSG
jgi:hypothetical protein